MPIPLKPGYNFSVEHRIKEGLNSMSSIDVYRDFYSIGYMIHGDRLMLTPEKTVIVNTGCVVFKHKNLYHRATFVNNLPYENFSIRFTDKVIKPLIDALSQEMFDSLFEDIVIRISEKGKQQLLTILENIEMEWNIYDENRSKVSGLMLESLLNEFVITVFRERVFDINPELSLSPKHQPLIDALRYIEKNFRKNPSLTETALAINISPSHLSKLFSQYLNTSYSRFLNEEKINHAQKLLVNTNLSMVEIAEQSGFSNSNYFCDAFKKFLGTSPLKFRKTMR